MIDPSHVSAYDRILELQRPSSPQAQRITMCYRDEVPEREYVWTDEGLANARRNGIGVDETTQALYAPLGLRYERALGDLLLIVMGMADSGRVIATLCDRIGATQTYKIIGARALQGTDLDEWRRRVL
ncbi:hypothetical protein [Plantactinospora sp. BC1]|uniref:hypothetical protein n=1 Tax=Plantactinospora sp. BC1 TaxID=2108470 RepID=UPI00131EE36C|nr:hypothetical protein [Plantactinospora sp. BC1]